MKLFYCMNILFLIYKGLAEYFLPAILSHIYIYISLSTPKLVLEATSDYTQYPQREKGQSFVRTFWVSL